MDYTPLFIYDLLLVTLYIHTYTSMTCMRGHFPRSNNNNNIKPSKNK